MLYKIILTILVSICAYFVLDRAIRFEVFKDFATHPETPCKLLKGVRGSEDLVKWKEFVIVSNLDAFPLFQWGYPNAGENISDGTIYVLYGLHDHENNNSIYGSQPIDQSIHFERAIIKKFPKNISIHSHGLGLIGDRLFVVNHAYMRGGERVDIFDISEEIHKTPKTEKSSSKVTLTYVSSVLFNEYMGTINDIIPVEKDEFYVTNYLSEPDPIEGRKTDKLSKLKNIFNALTLVKRTHILYCKGIKGDVKDNCKIVGDPGVMWNGITATPDGKSIFANDLIEKKIVQYERTETDDLKQVREFHLPHYCDNIHFDAEDGHIWMGGFGSLIEFILFEDDLTSHPYHTLPSHDQGLSPNGKRVSAHATTLDPKDGKFITHVYHHGTLLSGVSAAIRYGKKVILGSFFDDGIIICSPQTLIDDHEEKTNIDRK